ncbi:MAG TPA: transposase [Fimbriimonas sp.]|nr:transposase [Fimbriimonas sp.]
MGTWPHAPSRSIAVPGAYIVTSGTYQKVKLCDTEEKLELLTTVLLSSLEDTGWQLQAWSVFANHYHFVGISPDTGLGLTRLMRRIHGISARELNRMDGTLGRTVWYRCWDTKITSSSAHYARLAYVHRNPVKHGLVEDAVHYRWCSAKWLEEQGEPSFVNTIYSFKTDHVKVYDDF